MAAKPRHAPARRASLTTTRHVPVSALLLRHATALARDVRGPMSHAAVVREALVGYIRSLQRARPVRAPVVAR